MDRKYQNHVQFSEKVEKSEVSFHSDVSNLPILTRDV